MFLLSFLFQRAVPTAQNIYAASGALTTAQTADALAFAAVLLVMGALLIEKRLLSTLYAAAGRHVRGAARAMNDKSFATRVRAE